jgi:hypothetical protein
LLKSGCRGEAEPVSERFEELADLGSGIVLREASGKPGAVSTAAILESAVVDLAFQIVLDGEEGWGGLTEEERAWEEENRGEVNMPPFPTQARMCRQLGEGLRKLRSLEVCQTEESKELSAKETNG